ncbi:MAG: hypothetical protein JRC55_05105, partial [Deltaproteobacteria bacterium]|nr:hypothetical protein [Deltaproteobacteria bacterium]
KFYKDPSKDVLIAYFNNLKTGSEPVSGTILELPTLGSEFNRPPIDISAELTKAENLLKEKRYPEVLMVSEKILEYDRLNHPNIRGLKKQYNRQLTKSCSKLNTF